MDTVDALQSACQESGLVTADIRIELAGDGVKESEEECGQRLAPISQDYKTLLERSVALENENARLRCRVAELEDELHTGS